MPLDVSAAGQLEALFNAIKRHWNKLEILVHSIAFAPKEDLQDGLLNCSAKGFSVAMDVSCHSFVRMARLAAPLMTDGGTMFAMSYYGANKVVANEIRQHDSRAAFTGPITCGVGAEVRPNADHSLTTWRPAQATLLR